MSDRLVALDRLMSEIHDHVEGGETVPCLDVKRSHHWISDDAELQEAAAHGCGTCPALAACRRYVTQHPEPAGIWAGTRPTSKAARR